MKTSADRLKLFSFLTIWKLLTDTQSCFSNFLYERFMMHHLFLLEKVEETNVSNTPCHQLTCPAVTESLCLSWLAGAAAHGHDMDR